MKKVVLLQALGQWNAPHGAKVGNLRPLAGIWQGALPGTGSAPAMALRQWRRERRSLVEPELARFVAAKESSEKKTKAHTTATPVGIARMGNAAVCRKARDLSFLARPFRYTVTGYPGSISEPT
jgi:hypothetical protein